MKAALFAKQGLELREVSQPQPKPGEVLVRVRYAGLNRRDLTRSAGDEGTIPGMDWSGERADTGEAVMCMGAAGYAVYACSACVLPLPKGMDLESVLILGAASGVGLMGLQIGSRNTAPTRHRPGFRQYLQHHEKATAIRGRIVNVCRLGGMSGSTCTRCAVSSTSVSPSAADLWPALESGRLRLPVDKVFPLAQADAAQARMREDRHFGKILLRV